MSPPPSRSRRAASAARAGPAAGPGPLARLDAACARHDRAIAWGLAGAWSAAFVVLVAGKLRAFLYDDFDLALFAQAIHGVLRGSFASSIRGMPWLADHTSLILVPLAPLAALVPAPLLLVTLQCLALGAGAAIVHRIARRELGSPLASLALAAAWLLQPALGHVALFEFHPETLAVPALLVAWDGWREGRRARMTLAACVALLCKEDVAFAVIGLALASLAWRRRRGVADAALLAVPALAITLVSFALLKPMARGVVDYGRLYEAWGPTTGAALRAMAAHPARVIASLFSTPGDARDTAAKLALWVQLLGPWLFTPLAAPLAWLPAAPILLEHLMSDRIEQHVIVYQYPALLVPWLACGAIAGLGWLARRGTAPDPARARAGALAVLAAAALAQWQWGPFTARPGALPVPPPQHVTPDGGDRAMRPWRERLVRMIGDRDGIVSGFETMNRFHGRAHVYAAHHVLGGVYTFSDVPYPIPRGVEAAILDTGTPMAMDWMDSDSPHQWSRLVSGNGLVPVAEHGDLTLWLRGARDTLDLVTAGPVVAPLARPISYEDRIRLLGVQLPARPVPAGGEVPMVFSWQRHGDLDGVVEMALALRPLEGDPAKRAAHSRLVGYGLWSVDDWEDDAVMRERYRWVLPEDLPPGRYAVAIAAADRSERGLRPFATNRPTDADGFIDLGEVTVTAPAGARAP